MSTSHSPVCDGAAAATSDTTPPLACAAGRQCRLAAGQLLLVSLLALLPLAFIIAISCKPAGTLWSSWFSGHASANCCSTPACWC
jgi:hypothetical protein